VPSRASDIAVTIVLLMVHAFLWAATLALLGLLVMGTDSCGYQRGAAGAGHRCRGGGIAGRPGLVTV
jgi:hypothetical protein